ncbi:MAG: hypothetical protein LUE23_05155 [Lachnospiraceae bacterium]|nr:hypothetical protein [Lachnospiraceae bacterium]
MKRRKMIAPVVITVLVVVYYIVYFGILIYLLDTAWALLLGVIPLALAATMIWVCIQRIKEIRSGEEDDLGKY